MRIHNSQTGKEMHKELVDALLKLRQDRNFEVNKYLDLKCALLNSYMKSFGLKSCLVAVSGGIDSAVTLGIVKRASEYADSPIKKIVAVMLPVFSKEGATNQEDALRRGKEVATAFGVTPNVIDLTKVHALLKETVDKSLGLSGKDWASGQLVAYTRTPALYYTTSLLTESEFPGIICGTTNRDEGAYLGYVGKASDGMVDVQLISDLHKSEVYKVAEELKVPRGAIKAVPSGDMFDGRSDEEVFGAPYDFVELYLLYLSLNDNKRQEEVRRGWSLPAAQQFEVLKERLEALHNYNRHKYLGKSPAVHLDVCESNVPGGWNNLSIQNFNK